MHDCNFVILISEDFIDGVRVTSLLASFYSRETAALLTERLGGPVRMYKRETVLPMRSPLPSRSTTPRTRSLSSFRRTTAL
jgi:hypothetical protein